MTHFSLIRQVCQNFPTFFLATYSVRAQSLRFQQSLELYTGKHVFVKFEIFF